MLKKRIIPCLDIKDGRVLKGVQFLALKDAGNVNEVGVKQTEAQKYATEIIIADLKNSVIVLENTILEAVTVH